MRRKKQNSLLSNILVTLTIMLSAAVICTMFAEQHWFLDLFSHFVLHYSIGATILTILLLLYKRYIWSSLALIILITQTQQLLPLISQTPYDQQRRYDTVSILQYNVHRNNKNIDEITKWIISQSEHTDMVVLLEVNEMWQDALRRIKWAYPYHINKDMRGGRNMAIFSRLYIDEMEVKHIGSHDSPVIVLRGETTGYNMPFVLFGAHPPPPVLPSYTQERNNLLIEAAKIIAKEDATHKLFVADFNLTRFSPWFDNLTNTSGLSDSNEGLGLTALHGTWPNFTSKYLGITIDNVLISNNIRVVKKEIGPAMGSDHFPVLTTLEFLLTKENNLALK